MTNNAATFRQLHSAAQPLVLPNAWDAGSARLIESLGAKAIATTSAGVAWAHGYADGHHLPAHLLAATVAEIVRIVNVPVSTDIEGGYSEDLDEVEQAIHRVIDAGAVGINIEDGKGSVDQLCHKIERARRAADRTGVALFVNARTDVFLHSLAPSESRVEVTLGRAIRYRGAGADGLFVPSVVDADEIRAIVAGIALPLNVLAWPGLPDLDELRRLGVKRLSAGSGIARALFDRGAILTTEFLKSGRLESPFDHVMTYPRINDLMT